METAGIMIDTGPGRRLRCNTTKCSHHSQRRPYSPKAQDKVKSRFLLDVVVCKSPAIFKLLASEDEPLLIWRDALLVLRQSSPRLAEHRSSIHKAKLKLSAAATCQRLMCRHIALGMTQPVRIRR